jgi:DNA uptake protein ComE-like DNA-binding protein
MKRRTLTTLIAGLTTTALLSACGGSGDATADSANAQDSAAVAPATDTAAAASSSAFGSSSATRDQLVAVPGMTPAAADAIVAERPFENMIAVDRALAAHVADTTTRNTIYAQLFMPIDLNKATAEEIMLIPGVGPKMRHEFEEYRPYDDIAKFRREIRKYVKDEEVARLERYVTITK